MVLKSKKSANKGITLIALIITIIILLILAGISISAITNKGLFQKAKDAEKNYENAQVEEDVKLAVMSLQVEESQKAMTQDEKRKFLEDELKLQQEESTVTFYGAGFLAKYEGYEFKISGNYKVYQKEPFNADEWNKTATPEDVFIWQSDDSSDEGYGVVVGYTANVQNYSILKFPSRTTKVLVDNSYVEGETMRSFTKNVQKIELPTTVTEIGKYAFANYGAFSYRFESLQEINIPESVTSIGDYAFDDCDNLAKVTIEEGVASIGTYAFKSCANIASIIIPESVASIGGDAFSSCTNMTSIIIPESVSVMGGCVFGYWGSNQTIYCRANEKPSGWAESWDTWGYDYISGKIERKAQLVWGYTGD